MVFMTLKLVVLEKNKRIFSFPLFSFVRLPSNFSQKRPSPYLIEFFSLGFLYAILALSISLDSHSVLS